MRITKYLRADQENIARFLAVLGGGSIALSTSKRARPSFFIFAHTFIREYIEEGFFKKEELLIKALEDGGFPAESGPVNAMRTDHKKSVDAAEVLIHAAKQWRDGDEVARSEVGWATSQYTSAVRAHLERLKNLIFPLLEQTISIEDEHKISEGMNNIIFEGSLKEGTEKYIKLIGELEEELSDWK
ncbi:MAG: hemerythrin domain-containing protein [Chloroflexi bacterium]|nr:hemerythrin domain-containing protein [Chloroflexota bacterium]